MLNPDSLNDLIVINALRDKDNIDDFIQEFHEKIGINIGGYIRK